MRWAVDLMLKLHKPNRKEADDVPVSALMLGVGALAGRLIKRNQVRVTRLLHYVVPLPMNGYDER